MFVLPFGGGGEIDNPDPLKDAMSLVPAAAAFTMPAPQEVDMDRDDGSPVYGLPEDLDTIQRRICSYSWPCAKALRVAACESDYGRNDTNSYYVGIFQIDPYLHGWRGDIYTWEGNIDVAYQLWSEQGWVPWPRCRWY